MSFYSLLSRQSVRTCLDCVRSQSRIVLTRSVNPFDAVHKNFASTVQRATAARTQKAGKQTSVSPKKGFETTKHARKHIEEEEEDEEELYLELKNSARSTGLSDTVTPELEKEILAECPNKTFVLRRAVVEIKALGRSNLQLPDSLTVGPVQHTYYQCCGSASC